MSVNVKAPDFWFQKYHALSYALSPVGALYGLAVKARFALTKPHRSALPVICIGNFTVGGGGKTPLAIEVAKMLGDKGRKPVFLTRGYGGRIKGPHLVDLSRDTALDVGDEPLILAQLAPVVVSADRIAGAGFIERMEADVILMDDGFQNPTLHKNLSLIVIDEGAGVGNGRIFPAGPLRAGLDFQLSKADVLLIARTSLDHSSRVLEIERAFKGDIFRLALQAVGDTAWLRGARICAVTGIARPDKFYATLEQLGAILMHRHDFPDHHMFTQKEAKDLLALAKREKTTLVMTQKDWVRLPDTDALGDLRGAARVLYVKMHINQPERLMERLEKAFLQALSASQDSA